MRMLDLFCGRFGWGKAFASRGWEVVGVDLVEPPEVPDGCRFIRKSVLELDVPFVAGFDFVCASSPCEEFSIHGMRHFHPNPRFPDMGLVLFCWTRRLLDCSGVPYVMENVRAAQQFVGAARHRCGSFHLWSTAIPPLLPQGVRKGISHMRPDGRYKSRMGVDPWMYEGDKKKRAAETAVIAPELAGAVADYATRLCEVTA